VPNPQRAGLEYALQRVADPDPGSRWTPDGRPYAWQYAGSQVQVQLVDESGKVDLNQADAQILSSLLRAVGVEPAQAQQLAGAAVDWRDSDALSQVAGGAEDPDYAAAGLPYGAKDAPYESVAEVEQVLGWTPQLYARVRAYLTIYAGRGRPDPRYAQAPVLTALGLDPGLSTAYFDMGIALEESGDLEGAASAYREFIKSRISSTACCGSSPTGA